MVDVSESITTAAAGSGEIEVIGSAGVRIDIPEGTVDLAYSTRSWSIGTPWTLWRS